VNRSFYFPAFVFLLLFALLLLVSGQLSRFSVPCSTRESGKAIDRAALEKATLTIPQALTKRDLQPDPPSVFAEFRRRFSMVGLFPHPVKINVLTIDQQVDSSSDVALNKITRKLRRLQTHPKNHVHSSFNVKIVSRYRPEVNLLARVHCWLVGELGLAHTTNGLPWKEIRINRRSIKKRLMICQLATAGFNAHRQSEFLHVRRKARAKAKTFLCSR
jgi:hypothetical protein